MSVIKFEKPTLAMVEHIAANMRDEDRREVWASSNSTPYEALFNGWNASHLVTVVTVNNIPCVMLGLVKRDVLSGHGVPWLLGTEGALKHRRQFLKLSPPVIEEMLNVCPVLYNYVHVENTLSIVWLRWLGFTIMNPEPYGANGELFHKFFIER